VVARKLDQDPVNCHNFYRMSIESFKLLLQIVGPEIRKKDKHVVVVWYHTAPWQERIIHAPRQHVSDNIHDNSNKYAYTKIYRSIGETWLIAINTSGTFHQEVDVCDF
jgi:hypothetical protein